MTLIADVLSVNEGSGRSEATVAEIIADEAVVFHMSCKGNDTFVPDPNVPKLHTTVLPVALHIEGTDVKFKLGGDDIVAMTFVAV